MRARSWQKGFIAGTAVALALLDACAASTPGPVSPVVAAEEDASSPLTEGDVPMTVDSMTMKRSLRGRVLSIVAVPDASGWFDVELAGDDAPATRTLRVGMKAKLPFTAGDTLDVRWAQRATGWNAWTYDVELRDAQGALLAGLYTLLTDREGWTFELLPAAEDMPCRVAVTHDGHRAVVPTGEWRKLETTDGAWAAFAECPAPPPFAPGSPPVPDYSPPPTVVELSRLAAR